MGIHYFVVKVEIDRTMIASFDVRLDSRSFNPGKKALGNQDVVDASPIV